MRSRVGRAAAWAALYSPGPYNYSWGTIVEFVEDYYINGARAKIFRVEFVEGYSLTNRTLMLLNPTKSIREGSARSNESNKRFFSV